MSTTLNQLVRDQILDEGPDEIGFATSLVEQSSNWERYVDEQLNAMTNVELLERISNVLHEQLPDLSVRLGI
jgi:hypothetical protein